jgi:hypothetical protein
MPDGWPLPLLFNPVHPDRSGLLRWKEWLSVGDAFVAILRLIVCALFTLVASQQS